MTPDLVPFLFHTLDYVEPLGCWVFDLALGLVGGCDEERRL
jgi:hypothetical protein